MSLLVQSAHELTRMKGLLIFFNEIKFLRYSFDCSFFIKKDLKGFEILLIGKTKEKNFEYQQGCMSYKNYIELQN